MNNETLQGMTVIELRKVARENSVKLPAGISKAGIIEKILAADVTSAKAPAKEEAEKPAAPSVEKKNEAEGTQSTHHAWHAAILVDDEGDVDDDTPVVSKPAAPAPRPQYTPAPAPTPAPRPAAPAHAPQQGTAAPVRDTGNRPPFTLEGVRAWHNPRSYNPQQNQKNNNWQRQPVLSPALQQQLNQQPVQQRPVTPAYPQRQQPVQQRPVAPAYQQPTRFGPAETPVAPDYTAAGAYAPRPVQPSVVPPQPAYAPQQSTYAPQQPVYAAPQSAPVMPQMPVPQAGSDYRPRREPNYFNRDLGTSNPAVPEMLATGECGDTAGVLEVHPDGYGFLRTDNFLPGHNDVYVSNAQIRRFNLRSGDYIEGKTRPQRENDKYGALLYITKINDQHPDDLTKRVEFDDLTPIYPNKRIRLAGTPDSDPVLRLMDLLCPVGFGQRAMIVAPPKAGKTTIMKQIALAIRQKHPEAHLMVLLVDERPEEVTDIKETVGGEVLYSTFDEPPESHVRVTELALERAMRMVEQKNDVIILMDSLTRLARAYNATAPQTGRVMSGGLAAGIMHKPKRFFGAARNVREGGSLTIIATALVETGSRMDDVIFEEFKGTGNMELVLDRTLAEKRIFPAVSISRSGTRHDELLLTQDELDCVNSLRSILSTANEQYAIEQVLALMKKTDTNDDLAARLKEWLSMMKKDGFTPAK